MKRVCFIFCACSFFFTLSAQETPPVQRNGTLTLIPRDVYVGDTAVMRYTFAVPRGQTQLAEDDAIKITPDDARVFEESGVTVKTMSLFSQNESEYTLEISFAAWKTGVILIPPFVIPFENKSNSLGEISIPPLVVASLAQTLGETQMRPFLPPLLVPGTTYLLAAVFICAPLASVALAILARKGIIFPLHSRFKFSRGAKKALKKIKNLSARAEFMDDAECARETALVAREYLANRFLSRYTALTADETGIRLSRENEPPGTIEQARAAVVPLLRRCDLVRFAPDDFPLDERKAMIQSAKKIILLFERAEKSRVSNAAGRAQCS
jgi:hypothetical protein